MHKNLKSLFIIIPVHNRRQFTRNCLLSLRKQTFQKFTTILIDDDSSDGTAEMIKKEFTEVVLLHGDGNLWWTGATNLGVEHVLKNGTQGGYILTLNDDTIFQPNYLETLLVCAFKHPRSLIGSITINDSNSMIIEDGGVKINWCTAKFNFLARGKKYNIIVNEEPSLIPVDVLSGRGTLIPIEAFQEIGVYDFVRLPHYGADYEFSHRAKKKGYNLFVNYKSALINQVKSTINDNEAHFFKWNGFLKKFFSKDSPFCIRYRWNFACLTCPKLLLPSFFLFDIGRVFIGTLRSQLEFM